MLTSEPKYYMNLNGTVYQCRIAFLKIKLNELEFVDGSANISMAFDSCCIELPHKNIYIGMYGENIIDFTLYDNSDDAVLNDANKAFLKYNASLNALYTKRHDDLLVNERSIYWADNKHCFFCEEQNGGFLNRLFGVKSYSVLKSYVWRNGKPTSTNELAKDSRYDVINRYIDYGIPFVNDYFNYADYCSEAHKRKEIRDKNVKVVRFGDV